MKKLVPLLCVVMVSPVFAQSLNADANGDGVISQSEFMETERALENPERAQRSFERLDANGDGQLDDADRAQRAEGNEQGRRARLQRQFALIDTDGDGVISQDEYLANPGPGESGGERPEISGLGNDRGGEWPQPEQIAQRIRDRAMQHIERYDNDGDGRLTMEEAMQDPAAAQNPEIAQRMFEQYDTNDDGHFDRQDMDAMEAEMQERMQEFQERMRDRG